MTSTNSASPSSKPTSATTTPANSTIVATMSSSSSSSFSALPPFHSLPFPAYYRTECQDKYSTSRLAHHVAYCDNECASSLHQLTPIMQTFDDETSSGDNDLDRSTKSTSSAATPSLGYQIQPLVHGNQYSRKVKCFGPWVDAAGFANATLSEISQQLQKGGGSSKS